MSNKKYKTAENEPTFVREPVAVYGAATIGSAFSNQWNPNVPLYDTPIVAYTTSGKPLSQEQYVRKIEKAIAEADRNELITDDELEKEIATW